MKIQLECFFDCSSPWTYMAFVRLQPLAKKYAIDIDWKPILVGGVFNAVNQGLYQAREAMFNNPRRLDHYMKDIQDWANYCGIKIGWPEFHPVNSVKAMRGCFVAEEYGLLVPFATQVFEAYWGREEDISKDEILSPIIDELGIDQNEFFTKIQSQTYKDKLRANTEELIERGGYGSPTLFLGGDDMYFGNDRLPLLEKKLLSLKGTSTK
jgi:2-hydroxychromene-2-carboxylate isomerase